MSIFLRMFDSSEASLTRRLQAEDLPEGSVVSRFTYWYTSRPPAFEAVVTAPTAEE